MGCGFFTFFEGEKRGGGGGVGGGWGVGGGANRLYKSNQALVASRHTKWERAVSHKNTFP